VFPIPDTVIEYIWDFGELEDLDEKKYIESILARKNIFKHRQVYIDILHFVHKRFRNQKEEYGNVSLRDIQRFVTLFGSRSLSPSKGMKRD